MTDVIFPHSYTNTSCLQVFLYTNVDNLFKEAALALAEASHQEPLFAIVPGHEQKEALLNQYYKQNGFTNFVEIGTFPEIIKIILQKHYGYKKPQIHDPLSLTFAIYELFLNKDEAIGFTGISDEFLEDLGSVFSLANDIAQEFFNFIDLEPDTTDPKVVLLKQSIKKQFPHILFLDEAFEQCASTCNQMRFIGFSLFPSSYIKFLKNFSSILYLLVPSWAYLGDISSPKQALKHLRNKQYRLDEEFKFDEHPLLESLSVEVKDFYKNINELDSVFIDDAFDGNSLTVLQKMQNSLKTGYFNQKTKSDDSIKYVKGSSLYEECLLFFEQLQNIFKLDQSLVQTDIVVFADKNLYGPILNAIGNLLIDPIKFSFAFAKDPTWEIIEEMVLTDIKDQDNNFFIRQFQKITQLEEEIDKKCAWDLIRRLFSQSNLIYNIKNSKSSAYLKEIREFWLRRVFFDYGSDELIYDTNLMDNFDLDLNENLFFLFDSYLNFLIKINSQKEQRLSPGVFFVNLLNLIKDSFFHSFLKGSFYHEAAKVISDLNQFPTEITIEIFIKILGGYFYEKEKFTDNNLIKISSNKDLISKCYKYGFYLGEQKKTNKSFFGKLNKNHDVYQLYNFNNIKKAMIFIDGTLNKELSIGDCLVRKYLFKLVDLDKVYSDIAQLSAKDLIQKKDFFQLTHLKHIPFVQKEHHVIDAKQFENFNFDALNFLKKDLLLIKKEDELLDLEIAKRNLFLWKLMKTSQSFDEKFESNWMFLKKRTKHPEPYLRSIFTEHEEVLNRIKVKPHLQSGFFLLDGLSSGEIDDKFLKSEKSLNSMISIIHFLKG